ncbi:MAG: hypothetical protein MJA83_14990, partial [Gammaproteobacteria bacterium]|nr:hypothetical protein [Gammaproteobacteria bacterium]
MWTSFRTRLAHLLATQDNRITAHPVFVVQQRRRIYGLDTDYSDNLVWLDDANDCAEIHGELADKLEADYQLTMEEPMDYHRTGYLDMWEFVTACFTEQGCRDYIDANGHNLNEPRIYVESAHRNREWQRLREMLSQKPAELGEEVETWRRFWRDVTPTEGPVACTRHNGIPCGEAAAALDWLATSPAIDIARIFGVAARKGVRLIDAIKRFTFDAPGDQPNGPTEELILKLTRSVMELEGRPMIESLVEDLGDEIAGRVHDHFVTRG